MAVWVHDHDTGISIRNKRKLKSWIYSTILSKGKEPGEINIILTTDSQLLSINKQFLKHDYLTDIITFNYNEGIFVSGDLYISLERVKDNSLMEGVELNLELKRVIIHGILHLLGQNDKNSFEKIEMRSQEDKALKLVKDLIIL